MGRQGCALLGLTLRPFLHLLGGDRVAYSWVVMVFHGSSGLCIVGGDFKVFLTLVRR